MGRDVIDLSGKAPDAASTLKVLGNSFIFNMVEVIAEGHVLAEKAGLDNALLHEYVEKFFPGVYAAYSTRMMTGDYWNRDEVSNSLHSLHLIDRLLTLHSRCSPHSWPARISSMSSVWQKRLEPGCQCLRWWTETSPRWRS